MDHEFETIITEGTTTLATCRRCGVFELRTLNGTFPLVRINERHASCSGVTPSVRDTLERLNVRADI